MKLFCYSCYSWSPFLEKTFIYKYSKKLTYDRSSAITISNSTSEIEFRQKVELINKKGGDIVNTVIFILIQLNTKDT